MTFRTTVLPLGFGLSAVLCFGRHGPAAEGAPPKRVPVRVYTNADLDRVHALRDQTGVRSVPAVGPDEHAEAPADEDSRARREGYWRREAARVRDRIRAMEDRAAELRAQLAERAEAGRMFTRRRGSTAASGKGSEATLRARLAALERRMRQTEDDLADRARREGALPGWLR